MPGSPVTRDRAWSLLDPQAKRERLLRAAGEVFARQGIDAPMPAVAVAAGAGVGSIYLAVSVRARARRRAGRAPARRDRGDGGSRRRNV